MSCEVVAGLVSRWRDGRLSGADNEAYEQHLLFCPPCLAFNGKARRALDALAAAAVARPTEAFTDALLSALGPDRGR